MWNKVLWIIGISPLNGLLYRLGGATGYNTKIRDFGCALVTVLTGAFIIKLRVPWWTHILTFGLLFGALTTYGDKIFGYDNYYYHGFLCGLAFFPYAFFVGWAWIIIRAILLGLLMGYWCKIFSNHLVEDHGRGNFIQLTLLLFLLI